jgi:hypothetical protein
MHRHITLVGLLVPLLASGCGGPPPPPLYPVEGTVTVGGRAAAGGGLIFIPESGQWGGAVCDGSVNPDGTFTATTSRIVDGKTEMSPGVPAGRYKVTYHPPGNGEKIGLETELPDTVIIEPKDNLLKLDVPEGRTARELREQAAKKDDPAPDKK